MAAAICLVTVIGISLGEPAAMHGATMVEPQVDVTSGSSQSLSATAPWFGRPDPWAGIPFGSSPQTGPLFLTGDQGGRTITGRTFRNLAVGKPAIYLYKVRNLTIDLIDMDTVSEGILIYNSADVRIRRVRARNIYGPYTRTTAHTGNLLQIVNSRRIRVSDLKLDQPDTVPAGYRAWGTEDIISLGGEPGWGGSSWTAPFLIERFVIDGGAWQSRSGSGIFVGDGGNGKYVWIRDGILVNPGQVGIGTGSAGPYRFERINIKGPARRYSNDSIQLRTNAASFGSVRTDWRRADGTKVYPNMGGHRWTNLGGNSWKATLDLELLRSLAAL